MPQIYEYVKNNWIAISALIISFLSWIISFKARNETSRVERAEKRRELRVLIADTRIENIELQNKFSSIQNMVNEDIRICKNLISKNTDFRNLERYSSIVRDNKRKE